MTTETLMTDPAATNEGESASEQIDSQAATGAEGDDQSQQVTEGQGASTDEAKAPEGAPEKYEFAAPEGQQFDDTVIGAFSEVAKELNLPQDAAQKVLDKMAPVIQARQAEQIQAVRVEWAETAKVDKEFGGEHLAANLAVAKKGLDAFASPEMRKLLDDSGFGNHPEVIRTFFRAGKAISEDGFVGGRANSAQPNDARRLYAASNMNP